MIKFLLISLLFSLSFCWEFHVCQTDDCRNTAVILPNGSYYYPEDTQIPNSPLFYPRGTIVDVSFNNIIFWSEGTFVFDEGTPLGVEPGTAILPDGSIGWFPTPQYIAAYPGRWPMIIIPDEGDAIYVDGYESGSGAGGHEDGDVGEKPKPRCKRRHLL